MRLTNGKVANVSRFFNSSETAQVVNSTGMKEANRRERETTLIDSAIASITLHCYMNSCWMTEEGERLSEIAPTSGLLCS